MIALLLLLQLSAPGSFVPGAGGPKAWQRNTPAISGLTASPSATTVVLQWTTSIGSDSRGHCGTEEAVDDGMQSVVTSHQIIVAGLAPSTGYTCTVQSGASTATVSTRTNALATSKPITSVSIGTATQYNTTSPPHAMNGDTFYNFVSNDGTTYITTDDTVGWSGGSVSAAIMLAKFTSLSPMVGTNVNTLSGYGPCCKPQGPQGLSPKLNGLWGQAGQLYISLTNQKQQKGTTYPQYFGSLIMSPDHGATWNNMQSPATFSTTGTPMTPYTRTLYTGTAPSSFASSGFVVYGADDGTLGYLTAANRFDNGDAFVYGISNNTGGSSATWANGDAYYLWRVPRAKLSRLNGTDYQYYVSGDGILDASWSSNQASATAVISNTGKLSIANIEYIPALNRYLLLTFNYPRGLGVTSNTQWLVYESPHPWGSWTLVSTFNYPTTGLYNPVLLQADVLAATFSPTTMRVMWSGDFGASGQPNYNLFYATITVAH